MNAFLRGVASIFDFSGVLRDDPPWLGLPPKEADRMAMMMDAQAMREDWEAVVADFERARPTIIGRSARQGDDT